MTRKTRLALGAASLAAGLVACGPRDQGRGTTPPSHRGDDARAATRPANARPRGEPPPKTARQTPPPTTRSAPGGVQCPVRGQSGLTPVRWPAAQAPQRRYLSETRLDRVNTTKATPVEVCGARGQVAWLLRARCPSGAAPFTNGRTAHQSRVGNIGRGGRCGEIIDLYKVTCGAKTFAIHMSLYHCSDGQPFP